MIYIEIFKKKSYPKTKKKSKKKESENKNQIFESEQINFEEYDNKISKYNFLEYDDVPKSKTFETSLNIPYMNAPKQTLKKFNEKMTPLVLYTKTYGIKLNTKKPNSIILDFQKGLIDSKSCNDSVNLDDDLLFDEFYSGFDTERSTPDLEDIKDIQNCRKKMAIFRDSIDHKSDHSFDENDKIEYIFAEKKDQIKQNKENKKRKFWSKHIEQQKIIQNRMSSNKFRISAKSDNFIKKSETVKNQDIKDNGLFILGILESAAKEIKMKKKMRHTSNI